MPQTYAFALPQIEGYFSGVGDLFSALLLGFYKEGPYTVSTETVAQMGHEPGVISDEENAARLTPFAAAVSKALMGVQLILLKTHLWSLCEAEVSRAKRDRAKVSSSRDMSDDEDCLPSDSELDSLSRNVVGEDASSRPTRTARRMRLRELRIIQERDTLLKLAKNNAMGWPATRLDWNSIFALRDTVG